MNTDRNKLRILNRDVIKYAAMVTMLLNHISSVFLDGETVLAQFFLDVGYFTAPVMCYFLVEGYQYTRSKKKYGLRLFLFALLAEIPFCLAFSGETVIQFCGLNMLFTLFFCFLILVAKENIKNRILKILIYILLIGVTVICDWPLMAAIYTIFFAYSRDSRRGTAISYGFALALFAFFMYLSNDIIYGSMKAAVYTMGACMGFAAAAIVILFFYNGKRAEKGRAFSKWFFYLFYPGHLLILGLIRVFFLL